MRDRALHLLKMRDRAVHLLDLGLDAPAGEPVTDPAELPDDLDDLIELLNTFTSIAAVVRVLRHEVEAKTGAVLGPGRVYEYGNSAVRWTHPYKWRPVDGGAENFVKDLEGDEILDVFNINGIRKTGVEKVARKRGLDPDVAVSTVLWKDWDSEPRVSIRPLEDKK